jgi:stage V sporulation protein AD
MIYDSEEQPETLAGGSGPACSPLVNYSYIFPLIEKSTLKKVLIVATGALFSPTAVFQKNPILSISHAISLENVK